MKDERIVATKRSKKDTRDSKDTTSQEKPSTGDHGAAGSGSTLPINNNVNKNPSSSSSRQPESAANRTRTNTRLSQSSNDSSDKNSKHDTSDTRNSPPSKEAKLQRNSSDNRSRNIELSSSAASSRKTSDSTVRKLEPKSNEVRNVISEEKCKVSNLHELEDENFIRNDSSKREMKEKGKSKKKTKASRREEREREKRGRDKNTSKQQDRGESEDSGSDSSSEKIVPEVKIQQLSKSEKKSRRNSLPSVITVSGKSSNTSSETQDSNTKPKNRKNQSDGKKSKTEAQSSKAKSADGVNKKGPAANLVAEARVERAHTSPHAIATAISLALEKTLQTTSKENSYDEWEGGNRKKAISKATALSPRLTDSPPPISPTNLSGSSRSSSYSSIVSSDSTSSAPDQNKGKGKARVINSKSMPLAEPSLLSFPGLTKDQPTGTFGRAWPHSGLRFQL